jgi:ubiquinone/menaquinone biosynthesis C-methylase UbiE
MNAGMTTKEPFEQLYIGLRDAEGRIYTEEQVARLPEIPVSHPHFKEWQVRKTSCRQFSNYIMHKNPKASILEIGCGNGWLCHQLTKVTSGKITGVDVNTVELDEAKKVFGHLEQLEFIVGDPRDGILKGKEYDLIVFASSIQYFYPLDETIDSCLRLLKTGGEIHLMDTHFYKEYEREQARQRSKHYFEKMGFSSMCSHYFHHTLEDLKGYDYTILRNPVSIFNKLTGNKNPFYWLSIRGQKSHDGR